MKSPHIFVLCCLILFILNVILVLKLDRQQTLAYEGYPQSGNQPLTAELVSYMIMQMSKIQISPLSDDYLYDQDQNKIELKSIFEKEKVVIYLNKAVCNICVERFLTRLLSNPSRISGKDLIIISEVWNYREIILMKSKFDKIKSIYFTDNNFFSLIEILDKPVMFKMDSTLNPRNILVYDDFFESSLDEYMDLLNR